MSEPERSNGFAKILLVLLGVLIIGAAGAAAGITLTRTQTKPAEEGSSQSAPAQTIPQDDLYLKIEVGTSKEQVTNLAGKEADKCVDSALTQTCNYGSTIVIFSDGKVQSKSRF